VPKRKKPAEENRAPSTPAGRERPAAAGGMIERLSDMLELPKDLALDLPRVNMVGAIQVTVENHRGLVGYTPEQVRINTNVGQLIIRGREMMIGSVYEGEIIVTGFIRSVAIEEEHQSGPPEDKA